jgi:spore cortex biosynthesis protein YabQ
MNATVLQEFMLLLIDLAIGVAIGFLFDCYRVLRRLLRPGWLVTQLADFFFWVCCALLSFRVFFVVTGGAVNFYNILIIPIGTALYLKSLSPSVRRPLTLIFYQLGRLLALLFRAFCRIIRLLWLVTLLPFRGLWWLAHTCLRVAYVLLRLLWLPEKILLQWLWRSLREGWRSFGRWLRRTLRRILHRN